MFENVTNKEWDQFFEIMDKIVNDGSPYQEKMEAVRAKAREQNSSTTLEEFTEWFTE